MKKFILTFLYAAIVPAALSASPWDGTWKLDRAKSHLTGNSFTYSKTDAGLWHVAFGNLGYDFAVDGKAYPALDTDRTVIATMKGDHEIDFTNQLKGTTTSTMKETLSADGNTLTDEISGTHADGSAYTRSETSERSGAGAGFLGKWVSTKESNSSQGVITINTAADGTMTMTYPSSQEAIVGKLDGTPIPVNGPRVPKGVTITYKTASPNRLDYVVMLKETEVSDGYEELAADGKSFKDVSWAPGKKDESTTAVYMKDK